MGDVQLNLNEEQFGDLLKLVYLGNWLANGIYLPREQDERFNEIEQLVLSKAAAAGFGDLVQRDAKTGRYAANALFVNQPEVAESIADYDDEVFWDELVTRLVERDLIKERGEDEVRTLPVEERVRLEKPLLERYEKEVDKYGIDRLVIVK